MISEYDEVKAILVKHDVDLDGDIEKFIGESGPYLIFVHGVV